MDKNGKCIFFIKLCKQQHASSKIEEEIFVHESKLVSESQNILKICPIKRGSEVSLHFKSLADKTKVDEARITNLFLNRADVTETLNILEKSLNRSNQLEATKLLGVHLLWTSLATHITDKKEVMKFIQLQNVLFKICEGSNMLLKQCLKSIINTIFFDGSKGPLLEILTDLPEENEADNEYYEERDDDSNEDSIRSSCSDNTDFNPLRYRKSTSDEHATIFNYFLSLLDIIPEQCGPVVRLTMQYVKKENNSFSKRTKLLLDMLKSVAKAYLTNRGHEWTDFLEWNETPLFPTATELISHPIDSGATLKIVKDCIPYESEDDYMDTYFRLQRADGFSTLCDGIQCFNDGTLDFRDMNIYSNVSLVGYSFAFSGLSLALKIHSLRQVKDWGKSSFLMSENLLCITTSGDFSDPIWAKVGFRNSETLNKESIILVDLIDDQNLMSSGSIISKLLSMNGRILMAEAPTMYRSFGPCLSALQKFDMENFPFNDALVFCNDDNTEPPEYLKHAKLDLSPIAKDGNYSSNIYEIKEDMHSIQSTLADSQKDAIVHALTNKIAIIQGPPGTGKTFLGSKLAEILLNISTPSKRPILVITYKNHALDEFLKGLIENGVCTKENICRIGGRSKEAVLEPCLLFNRMKLVKSPVGKELYEKHNEIRDAEEEVAEAILEYNDNLGLTFEELLAAFTDDQIHSMMTNGGMDQSANSMIQRIQNLTAITLKNMCLGNCNKTQETDKIFQMCRAKFQQWFPSKLTFKTFQQICDASADKIRN